MKNLLLLTLCLFLFSCENGKKDTPAQEKLTKKITLEFASNTPESLCTRANIDKAWGIIDKRLRSIGVKKFKIKYTEDFQRLTIKLPEYVTPKDLQPLLSHHKLTFHVVTETERSENYIRELKKLDSISTQVTTVDNIDNLEIDESEHDQAPTLTDLLFDSAFKIKDTAKVNKILTNCAAYLEKQPYILLWSSENAHYSQSNQDSLLSLYMLKKDPDITGDVIKEATSSASTYHEDHIVNLAFTSKGAQVFARVTRRNINKQLAIVVGDRVLSAPSIREAITTGNAQISGKFTKEEAKILAAIISHGSLPAPLTIIKEETL